MPRRRQPHASHPQQPDVDDRPPCPGADHHRPDPRARNAEDCEQCAQVHGPPPPATDGPVCSSCRRNLVRALEDLPELYVALYVALEPGSASAHDRVSGSRSAPLPLRADVEILMRQVLDVILCWEEVVRDVARLSPPAHGRAGPALTSACRLLGAHTSTLLALPATAVSRRVPAGQVRDIAGDVTGQVTAAGDAFIQVTVDGPGAADELVDVARRCEGLLGRSRGKDRKPGLCPACDRAALVRWHGSELVECEACGNAWPERHYRLALASIAAERTAPTEQDRTDKRAAS